MSTPPAVTSQFDALRDAILRGIAHALSNRVAALGGVSMLADPGQIWTERLSKALQDEARRLEELLRLMRLLPNDGRGEPGAVELQPLVPDVVALHAYNSALLQVECATVPDRETMPVFANRPQLVHALLLCIDTAKRHAINRGARVVVSYTGDSERVTIRVVTEPSTAARPGNGLGDKRAAPVPEMDAGLPSAIAGTGGSFPLKVSANDSAIEIEMSVPTLAAGRRNERAASGARPAT